MVVTTFVITPHYAIILPVTQKHIHYNMAAQGTTAEPLVSALWQHQLPAGCTKVYLLMGAALLRQDLHGANLALHICSLQRVWPVQCACVCVRSQTAATARLAETPSEQRFAPRPATFLNDIVVRPPCCCLRDPASVSQPVALFDSVKPHACTAESILCHCIESSCNPLNLHENAASDHVANTLADRLTLCRLPVGAVNSVEAIVR